MRQTSVNKRGRVMVRGDKTSGSSASSHSLSLSQPGGKIKKEWARTETEIFMKREAKNRWGGVVRESNLGRPALYLYRQDNDVASSFKPGLEIKNF